MMHEKESELKRFSLADYEVLESQVRRNARGRLTSYLDESKVTGEARFKAMRESDPDNVLQEQVYNYLTTTDGVRKALTLAAKKIGMTDEAAAAFADSYDIVDGTNLARSLVGFERRVNIDAGDKEKAHPNG